MGVTARRRSTRRHPLITVASRLVSGSNAVLSVPVFYLGALTVVAAGASCRGNRGPGGRALGARADAANHDAASHDAPRTRFVVVIPAHDESGSIGRTLISINECSYPRDLVDVHVVADNCTDDTALVAARCGAHAHVRDDLSSRGKGPALNWLLGELGQSGTDFDAAVFIDADTVVDPGFLTEMDRQFRAGEVVVQGSYEVNDAFTSAATAMRWCALACRHHLRPLGRTTIGGSCGLFGNGMAMTSELALRREWSGHLVEDMEFQLELLLDGISVAYAPRARVFAEMPNTLAGSVTQHQRWERGRVQLVFSHGPRLVRRLFAPQRSRRIAFIDALADLSVPPLSMLAASLVAATTAGAALGVVDTGRSRVINAVTGPALCAVLGVHVVAGLRLMHAPRVAYRALAGAPALVWWKLSVIARMAVGGHNDGEWIRTARNEGGTT